MKAVYTWHLSKKRRWITKEFEIITLVTSLNYTLKQFKDVVLYTDEESLKELKDYKLPSINVILKERVNHNLWILDKVNTYSIQTEPFIHIDADFIIEKELASNFLISDIGFQSFDDFNNSHCFFYKNLLNNLLIKNIIHEPILQHAYNFGIYLCNNLEINKIYCEEVFKISERVIKEKMTLLAYNTPIEQHTITKILKNYNIIPSLLLKDYNEKNAEEVGFIHILHNKNNKKYFEKIKNLYE